MKKFTPTQEMIRAAEKLFVVMAKLDMIRPIVEGYKKRILAENQWRVRPAYQDRLGDRVILEIKDAYLMSDDDFVKYDALSKQARDVAELRVDDPNKCPLLVAEHSLIQAKRYLIEAMEPLTKVNADKLLNAGLGDYEKYVDLAQRLLAPYVRSASELLSEDLRTPKPESVRVAAVIERLAVALRKMTVSVSANLGTDCAEHAYLGQAILSENGIDCRVVIGVAAWRVGPNSGDVMVHCPQKGAMAQPGRFAYHAWIETEAEILDFSTHTMLTKMAQLDALDGGSSSVVWCPPYLRMLKSDVKTLQEVAQAPSEGVAFYQEVPGLVELMKSLGFRDEVDATDLAILRHIFTNDNVHVIGPNDCIATTEGNAV